MSCRKKIDSKQWTEYTQLMESEVRSLKRELEQTREALRLATKRCRELVCELDNRTAGHESERALRDQQLSRILRALLAVEGRLRQEQKSIRQLLREKDNVIRNQQLEIAKLRRYAKNYMKCKRDGNSKACKRAISADSAGSEADVDDSTTTKTTYDRRSGVRDGDADVEIAKEVDVASSGDAIRRADSLNEETSRLKREIIDRLNDEDSGQGPHRGRSFVRKNYSFAESDVSKSSLTSGENTDLSTTTTVTITTTTEEGDAAGSSPSLVSTEGFCEGESDDASPGSTLNKPNNRCIIETKVAAESSDEDCRDEKLPTKRTRTRHGVGWGKTTTRSSKASLDSVEDRGGLVSGRDDSNEEDDGMDCRFVSDEDEEEEEEEVVETEEPLYQNSGETARLTRTNVDCVESARHRAEVAESSAESVDVAKASNAKRTENPEETSGNWYSDPDEDKAIDDVFRHMPSRPNDKHNNSVLECVNQILLRDMEEEENALLSIPRRRFKHRGRIVRFQPAKLSDIESVGSEMERKNSDQDHQRLGEADPVGSGLANGIGKGADDSEKVAEEDDDQNNHEDEDDVEDTRVEAEAMEFDVERAVPIVVIEPVRGRPGEDRGSGTGSGRKESKNGCCGGDYAETVVASKMSEQMEEERTCLRMSSRGLTIPRQRLVDRENAEDDVDDDDVVVVVAPSVAEESRCCDSPRSPGTRDKTPPALPPRPNYRNTSLILKKIPSPSFLIDEPKTRRPASMPSVVGDEPRPRSLLFAKTSAAEESPLAGRQRQEGSPRSTGDEGRSLGFFARNGRFGDRGSPIPGFRSARRDDPTETYEGFGGMPKVTSIVRHFEEFKIGEADEADRLLMLSSRRKGESGARTRTRTRTTRDRGKPGDKLLPAPMEGERYDEDDIRQNFEEFRLDDCDLFNDDDAAAAAAAAAAEEETVEACSKDADASTANDPDRPEADGSERLATDPSAVVVRVSREESYALGRTRTTPGVRDVGGNAHASDALGGGGGGYDHFLEATGLSTKSILLTPSRLLSNHKSMLKPKDVKYKNKIKATAVLERHGVAATGPSHTRVKRWTGPFV